MPICALDLLRDISIAIPLLHPPAGRRVQRRRAQRLAGTQAEVHMMPRTPNRFVHQQPVRERRAVVRAKAPMANASSPRRASSTGSPCTCPSSMAPSGIVENGTPLARSGPLSVVAVSFIARLSPRTGVRKMPPLEDRRPSSVALRDTGNRFLARRPVRQVVGHRVPEGGSSDRETDEPGD